MRYNVPLYFERKNIKISDIFYLTRQNPHTIITFSSGESIATTIPIKELMLYLPEEDFLNISKGVVLRKNQIVHISDEGLYPFIILLFTDASSIIKSIKKIHAQHVDLTPDNPHVLRYTGRKFSWVNNLPEKTKQFTSFAGKPQGLQGQKQVIK